MDLPLSPQIRNNQEFWSENFRREGLPLSLLDEGERAKSAFLRVSDYLRQAEEKEENIGYFVSLEKVDQVDYITVPAGARDEKLEKLWKEAHLLADFSQKIADFNKEADSLLALLDERSTIHKKVSHLYSELLFTSNELDYGLNIYQGKEPGEYLYTIEQNHKNVLRKVLSRKDLFNLLFRLIYFQVPGELFE